MHSDDLSRAEAGALPVQTVQEDPAAFVLVVQAS